jgi:broad specificity phosphatase PhoE
MARYILVRHGLTGWIERGTLHGATDIPLSETGREQACLTAGALRTQPMERVYASPLSRAMETAQIICRERGIQPDAVEGFREMDFGFLEGKRDAWHFVKERRALIPVYFILRNLSGLVSGESISHFLRRVADAWEEIKTLNPQGAVGLIAHAGVLRAILVHEFGGPYMAIDRFSLFTCSITELDAAPGQQSKIIRLNDMAHLDGKVFD